MENSTPALPASSVVAPSSLLFKASSYSHKHLAMADDDDLGEYQVVAALFQEIYSIVPSSRRPSSTSVELALKRCQVSHDRLFGLLQALGYGPFSTPRLGNALQYKVKRRLKRNKKARFQASYRDAVLLLCDIVTR